MDRRPYSRPKIFFSRTTGNNGLKYSPVRGEEVVPRVRLLSRFGITIEEKKGDKRAPGGPMEDIETNTNRDTDLSHDGSRDVIGDLHVDHRLSTVVPEFTIQERTKNKGAGKQSRKEARPSPDVTIDKKSCPENGRIAGELDVTPYRHKSGELYAEDVDQHMAVLPDIVMPSAEITIDDI